MLVISFGTNGTKIASYLKLKKDDRLLVSYAFAAKVRPKTFLKVWLEPSPTYNCASMLYHY